MAPGEPAFSVADYQGVPVTCEREHWDLKVLRDHPELAGREGDVATLISEPQVVLQDRAFPDRKHYVRRFGRRHYLVAVVAYSERPGGGVSGILVTAFRRSGLRRGDRFLYARSLRSEGDGG